MRPTTANVRLDDIIHNYNVACRFAPASRSIAVVKANAYGHGLVDVARALENQAPVFAVAFIDEAVQLRDAGIRKPILILQGASRASDIAEAVSRDFWLLLHHRQQVEWAVSSDLPGPVTVWLKVESGMNRLGFVPEDLTQVCERLTSSPNIRSGMVLCTQLACADDLTSSITGQQLSVMHSLSKQYQLGLSIANSAAIVSWPETHAEWNRPGYMLYGLNPLERESGDTFGLRPAMTMRSELITVKEIKAGEGTGYGLDWRAKKASKLGTVAIGYGDGYPRHAPSGTPVLVNGQRVPLVGRVSMDLISVDLTCLERAEIGDPVELWGRQLSVNEVAGAAGTIGYELLASLTGRVPLVF